MMRWTRSSVGIVRKKVNWVLDADIRDFFTRLDQSWLERFLEHRIADERVLRLIQKWLRAGVIEDGEWSETLEGTAQGASVSPLLANVYLHYVFDLWADQWRRRHARGEVVLVRFADDYVVGFEHREDAERFLAELRDRFAQFGLELHPEKTRLIEFGRFAAENRARRGDSASLRRSTFLGFTHICAKTGTGGSSSSGSRARRRCGRSCSAVKAEMRGDAGICPIPEQGRWLASVLAGHYRYYAVPDNSRAVQAFRERVIRHWLTALRRRSQRSRHDLGADAPPRRPMATHRPHPASLARRALRRQNPREEPSALDAHAGSTHDMISSSGVRVPCGG